MKLLFFDDFKLGVLNGDNVVDVSDLVADIPHGDPQGLMAGLIERFDGYKDKLAAAAGSRAGVPVASVRIRPPLPKPAVIDCMAVNYMENGTRSEPARIDAFQKPATSVIGNGDTMVLPDVAATIFEGEAELALVIGKRASKVAAADAMQYIFGYTCFIDGSARGVSPPNNTFFQMKTFETFCPIGPVIVTADEIADPQSLAVKLWNNGDLMQDFNTDDMAHKIPRCVEFLSGIHPLDAGDIIATGTNHRGLHAFQDGDKVEIEIEGVGRLMFNVSDPLKRTWARQTRLERQDAGQPGTTPQLTGKYAPAVAAGD